MGLEEDIAGLVSELRTGRSQSLFGALTVLRTSIIKSTQGRKLLVKTDATKLLLDLLGDKSRHGGQMKMSDIVMSIVANLCMDDAVREQVLKCGGLETIAIFTLSAEQESIQNRGVRALSNLAQNSVVVDELFNLEVPEFVAKRLLETEDEECRVTFCRALRQIGKTSSAVRRLVEDTQAVQALATMLKLDNKNLALKGLRTLAEFSALRCCSQFTAQVLSAKAVEELVTYSDDEDSDIAHFSLTLVYRLCEQGLVRPALGAAGVVTLLVRLMSSTRSHINQVSVLNALCLCSKDSVNRNKIRDSGGLEVFMSVLKGEENVFGIQGESSAFERGSRRLRTVRLSQFSVLYDRVISSLVNFIYHDDCLQRLLDVGLVDVLLKHLQRCSEFETSTGVDIKRELEVLVEAMESERRVSERARENKDLSDREKIDSELYVFKDDDGDNEDHKKVATLGGSSPKETVSGRDSDLEKCETERRRHESTGFKYFADTEFSAEKDTIGQSNYRKTVNEEETQRIEEEQLSKHIHSRDPLNIDNQELEGATGSGETSTNKEMKSMGAGDSDSCSPGISSRKARHTFSINSPTYQSEASWRMEDYTSGVTCKNFSLSHSHSLTQGGNAGNGSNNSVSSPARYLSPQQNSSQSPYSPLSADASYYSPTHSSPSHSEAPFSPPSSLPPHSPSPSSQLCHSPGLSILNSSMSSPAHSTTSFPSPFQAPPYQSPQAGSLTGPFSPLSTTNFPGSPAQLTADDADAYHSQTLGISSPRVGAMSDSQGSAALFPDRLTDSPDHSGLGSGFSQSHSGVDFVNFTQSTLSAASPVYSATDDEEDEETERGGGDGSLVLGRNIGSLGPSERHDSDRDKIVSEFSPKAASEIGELFNEGSREEHHGHSQGTTTESGILLQNQTSASVSTGSAYSQENHKSSKRRSTSPECDKTELQQGDSLGGNRQSLKRFKLDSTFEDNSTSVKGTTLAVAKTELSLAGPSFSTIVSGSKRKSGETSSNNGRSSIQAPSSSSMHFNRDMRSIVPRSSKVAKKFQRMLSLPGPDNMPSDQKGFKKRASHPVSKGEAAVSPTIGLGAAASNYSPYRSPFDSQTGSPGVHSDPQPSTSTQQEAPNSQGRGLGGNFKKQADENKTSATSSTLEHNKPKRSNTSDQRVKKILRATESNILILLSTISVKPSHIGSLAEAKVIACLLDYVRTAPNPLQRCCRILTRMFSNPLVFHRLLVCQAPALVVKSLILEEDGTFPATMFCTEWENQFGLVQRSRMNLSDLLTSTLQSVDDDASGATGSQASDFGRKLDFEFGGDAYSRAKSLGSSTHATHRLFRFLYHDGPSLSTDSQSARDETAASPHMAGEEVYVLGLSRAEVRVRVGLNLLRSLGAVAMSSYGDGEIQHVLKRGSSSDALACRVSLLHMPLAWSRMTRHQFALKHLPAWEFILPCLFLERTPQITREVILVALSFNIHLDLPPKLVGRVSNLAPCPCVLRTATTTSTGSLGSTTLNTSELPVVMSSASPLCTTTSVLSSAVKTSSSGFTELLSESALVEPNDAKSAMESEMAASLSQSPQLFDDEEKDGSVDGNHDKCPYWTSASSHDVFFIINENSITYKYGANRVTMVRKSEVFAAMLGGAYAERLKEKIDLTDTKAASFECVLHYLHGCTCSSCSVLSCLTLNKFHAGSLNGTETSPSTIERMVSVESVLVNAEESAPYISLPNSEQTTVLSNEASSTSSVFVENASYPNQDVSTQDPSSIILDQVECEDSLDSLSLQDKSSGPKTLTSVAVKNATSEHAMPADSNVCAPVSGISRAKGSLAPEEKDDNRDQVISIFSSHKSDNSGSLKSLKSPSSNEVTADGIPDRGHFEPFNPPESDPNILPENEQAQRALEELINTCAEVLALADRFLLSELVAYISSVLSHVCLQPHTWDELFPLACFYKLRPLAVDCMREALTAHVPIRDTVASLHDLGVRGYKDQAVETLSLLLKSARIH